MKHFIDKTKKAVEDNSLKVGAIVTATVMTTPAFASIEVDSSVNFIEGLNTPVNKVGAAILGVGVLIFGWRRVTGMAR